MPNLVHRSLALATAMLAQSGAALAVDGQVLITQDKAVAGGVTPGDAAGFPVTVSRAGGYKLASNLSVPSGKIGIEVTSPNVTLDLNGFRLSGNTLADSGIVGRYPGLTVKNGAVEAFRFEGISFIFDQTIAHNGQYWMVDHVRVAGNGRIGILGAEFFRLSNSTVEENVADGVNCRFSCLVERSMISNNGLGVLAESGTVLGNTIINNRTYALQTTPGIGYGNNTITGNNPSGPGQITGAPVQMTPNACTPVC